MLYRVSQKKIPRWFWFISPLLGKLQKWIECSCKEERLPLVLSTEQPLSTIWSLRYVELELPNQEMKKICVKDFTFYFHCNSLNVLCSIFVLVKSAKNIKNLLFFQLFTVKKINHSVKKDLMFTFTNLILPFEDISVTKYRLNAILYSKWLGVLPLSSHTFFLSFLSHGDVKQNLRGNLFCDTLYMKYTSFL